MPKTVDTKDIVGIFIDVHGDKYNYDRVEYIDSKTKVWIGCKVEGHGYFEQTPNNHKRGKGCKKCAIISRAILKSTPKENSIRKMNYDMVKYLKFQNESDEYTFRSTKKLTLICPDCKKENLMSPDDFYKNGFSCSMCSDGISIPEKFGRHLFERLNLCFDTQYRFENINRYYDFYIIHNNVKYIIEVHGLQHYEQSNRGLSLNEELENDLYKYNIAIQNGISPENYIVIDCRYSDFEWLKNNYIKSLDDIFDLSNIYWMDIWTSCQSSSLFKVCDFWNNKNGKDTTMTVAKQFKVSDSTIRRWLKCGNDLGLCVYNPHEERIKASSKVGNLKKVKTYQYLKTGEFIKEWNSAQEAFLELNINYCAISMCCNGKRKTAGGFVWSHNPPKNS